MGDLLILPRDLKTNRKPARYTTAKNQYSDNVGKFRDEINQTRTTQPVVRKNACFLNKHRFGLNDLLKFRLGFIFRPFVSSPASIINIYNFS